MVRLKRRASVVQVQGRLRSGAGAVQERPPQMQCLRDML